MLQSLSDNARVVANRAGTLQIATSGSGIALSKANRPFESADDLSHRNLSRRSRHGVTTLHAAMGGDETMVQEHPQYLAHSCQRQLRALGQFPCGVQRGLRRDSNMSHQHHGVVGKFVQAKHRICELSALLALQTKS